MTYILAPGHGIERTINSGESLLLVLNRDCLRKTTSLGEPGLCRGASIQQSMLQFTNVVTSKPGDVCLMTCKTCRYFARQ